MDYIKAIEILKDMYNRKINSLEYITKKQKLDNKKECEALKIAYENLEIFKSK